MAEQIHIPADDHLLEGIFAVPDQPQGLVIFAHGSGSSRFSPRNSYIADRLNQNNFATLLFDLLTAEEDVDYESHFAIDLLANRLVEATDYISHQPATRDLPLGYFGASTGSAAAIKAAASTPDRIKALVSRGGRPDLAMTEIAQLQAPTLFIVGGHDLPVLQLNKLAYDHLAAPKALEIIPAATHLFEEPGKLAVVADLTIDWFQKHLTN